MTQVSAPFYRIMRTRCDVVHCAENIRGFASISTRDGGTLTIAIIYRPNSWLQDMIAIKTNNFNFVEWQTKLLSGSGLSPEQVIEVPGQGYYITGESFNVQGLWGGFLTKLNFQGAYQGTRRFGVKGSGFSQAMPVPTDMFHHNGRIYVVGTSNHFYQGQDRSRMFIYAFDYNGNILSENFWQAPLPHDYNSFSDGIGTPDGGCLIAGEIDNNTILVKLNPGCQSIQWMRTIDMGHDNVNIQGIAARPNNSGYVVVGYSLAGVTPTRGLVIAFDHNGNIDFNMDLRFYYHSVRIYDVVSHGDYIYICGATHTDPIATGADQRAYMARITNWGGIDYFNTYYDGINSWHGNYMAMDLYPRYPGATISCMGLTGLRWPSGQTPTGNPVEINRVRLVDGASSCSWYNDTYLAHNYHQFYTNNPAMVLTPVNLQDNYTWHTQTVIPINVDQEQCLGNKRAEETAAPAPAPTLSIFPQPAATHLTLESPSLIRSYRVFDLTGRLLRDVQGSGQQQQTIDLTELPDGNYVLDAQCGTQRYRKRFSVQR